jgi:preprotein translocase subunit SecA
MASEVIKCNRLAEVKTGEGKSIVLAVLSIYFALFGYEVHCACYSNMLSKRDEK